MKLCGQSVLTLKNGVFDRHAYAQVRAMIKNGGNQVVLHPIFFFVLSVKPYGLTKYEIRNRWPGLLADSTSVDFESVASV
jgi:hypothetical protein